MKTEKEILSRIEKYYKLKNSVKGKNVDAHHTRTLFGAVESELREVLSDKPYTD